MIIFAWCCLNKYNLYSYFKIKDYILNHRAPLKNNKHLSVYNIEPYLSSQIFNLLPVKKASHVPHNVEDRVECLLVRPRRYAIPYRERNQRDDAHTVFQVLSAQTLMYKIKHTPIYVVVA